MAWPVSTQFLAALASPVRTWRWRLEVEWACNALDPLPSTSSSQEYDATYMPVSNLVTGIPECRPYTVLDHGCLADGSWYALPEEGTLDVRLNPGWWSSQTSDAEGNFSTPPYVEAWYPEPDYRMANLVRIVTTRYYPGVSIVRVKYRLPEWTDWATLGDFSLSDGVVEAQLPSLLQLRAVRVEILSTSEPNDHARLAEVDAVWRETFEGDAIARMDVTRRLEFLASTGYPLGTLAASDLAAEIFLDAKAYEPYLRPLVRLRPWWGLLTAEGWEWVPQGEFFADEWERGSISASVRARDRMGLFVMRNVRSRLLGEVTLLQALHYLVHYGWVPDYQVVPGIMDTDTHDWMVLQGDSVATALRGLTQATLHHVWFDLQGQLRVRQRTSTGSAAGLISDSDLLSVPTISRGERCNRVRVEWRELSRGPCQEVGSIPQDELGETVEVRKDHDKSPVVAVSGMDVPDGEVLEWTGDEWGIWARIDGGENARILGQPLEERERAAEASDDDLIRREGIRELVVSSPAVGPGTNQAFADRLLSYLSQGRERLTIELPPRPHWEAGDVITVVSERTGVSADYLISSISIEAGGTTRMEVTRV